MFGTGICLEKQQEQIANKEQFANHLQMVRKLFANGLQTQAELNAFLFANTNGNTLKDKIMNKNKNENTSSCVLPPLP